LDRGGAHSNTDESENEETWYKMHKKKVGEWEIDVPLILDLGKMKRDAKRAPNKIVRELVTRPAAEVATVLL
jgi:hypothetical protein